MKEGENVFMVYDNLQGVILYDKKRQELIDNHYYPIPVAILKERYWINEAGTIVDSGTTLEEDVKVLYERTICDITSNVDISTIILPYGEDRKLATTPAELYVLTFYGYLPAKTYRITSNAQTKRRYVYNYAITQSNENSIFISNVEFRYSKLYNVYASKKGGCIFNGRFILSHTISKKGHHQVNASVITGPSTRRFRSTAIHRIIYDAWIGIKDPKNVIHHIDGYPWHNDLDNLIELTPEEHTQAHIDIGRRNMKYTAELVEKVCKLMQDGYRPAEAARIVGIPAEAAVRYRAGQRPEISGKYDYPELGQYRRTKLTDEIVHEICKLFVVGKLSNREIGKMFGYSPETIRDIRERRTWRDLSSQYEFSSDNPIKRKAPPKGTHNAAKITEDDVIKIYNMLHEGIPPKKVSQMTGISYQAVRKIRYKVRWVELTDRLDAQYANGENGSTTIERIT